MIELHYFPGNASMTPHLLLQEAEVPFKLQLVDRAHDAHKSPAYLKLNPNGLIPVLTDGELVLYETAAIVLYLVGVLRLPATAQSRGEGWAGRLAPPADSHERAHFDKWLVWLAASVQSQMALYFYPERYVAPGNEAAAAEVKAHAEARIGALFDQLDAHFAAHGGPWLMGDRYSALDPYALMLCRWTRGFKRPARTLARLGPFTERMLARPAVQRVFATEQLAQPYV